MSKKLGLFLSMIMVLSMVLTAWSADFDAAAPSAAKQADAPELTSVEAVQIYAGYVSGEIKGATEPAIYLIRLVDPPLARYQGGIEALGPTSLTATGESKLDVKSPASVSYLQYLAGEQANLIADALRQQGPFEPHRLSLDEGELQQLPTVAARTESRWVDAG